MECRQCGSLNLVFVEEVKVLREYQISDPSKKAGDGFLDPNYHQTALSVERQYWQCKDCNFIKGVVSSPLHLGC
jgi:hypothetical protein